VANIKLDYSTDFSMQFIADLPLDWQVIRVRNGTETVVKHGSTASPAPPPPPPDTAIIPGGTFAAGDTLKWGADLFAPENNQADYTLNVEVWQQGQRVATDGPHSGTIPANGDNEEMGSWPCV
jgi:hypothetical protein